MPRSRRQKRLGQRQAVSNDGINKGKCEVWVGNLPHYGMNTNNILLFEWWITLVMKGYFADCLRNRFEVECIIKDEIDLDQSRNSNTYTSAVLIFASEKHATCALKLNGITFLQKKLKIGRKQPSTYVDWINTGYSNKWDNLVPDWQVEGTIAEDPWREDHKTINYYSTLSVADATEETSSVFGSTEDKHPEESIVVDDRLVEYKSSLSCKFNAALKEEENHELDYPKSELAAEGGGL